MIDIADDEFAEIFGERLDSSFLFIQSEISIDMLIVVLRIEHGLEVIKMDGLVGRRREKPLPIFRE
jgi:hypothetical protein